ncbi:MAG TPA: hypothetical protein VE673_03705, partial [Pseudonocardiaceae bacterium]|nr:hypothetical protein [Pseudonocardiaceae bacterium]
RALNTTTITPVEVITDKAAVYPQVLDELAPGGWHHSEQYATDEIVNRQHCARWGLFSTHSFRPVAVV